jgi:hypothetical protein
MISSIINMLAAALQSRTLKEKYMCFQESLDLMVRNKLIQYLNNPFTYIFHQLLDEEQATQIIVSLDDVKEELEEKMKLKNIKNYKMDVCTKKYAFELPDIPQETQYIKLTYPFHRKLTLYSNFDLQEFNFVSFSI